MFTQHDMAAHQGCLLMQACHKTAQGGRDDIHQLLLVLGRWTESLLGKEVVCQCQGGSNGQKGKYSSE